MAKERYISAYNIAKKLTEEVKKSRHLSKNSDAFYFVALKYHLGLDDDTINECITDLSYGMTSAPNGKLGDNGIDAVYLDRISNIVYIYNFKYQEKAKPNNNYPSDECHKILSYLDILFNFDGEKDYYLNERLQSKTKEIVEYMSDNVVNVKVVLASNYFDGLEQTKRESFKSQLSVKSESISFEEFHLNELMQKYLNRMHSEYVGRCVIDKDLIFPKKTNQDSEFVIAKISTISLLKLFLKDQSKRESKQPILPSEIIASEIDDNLFDDNVRIFLTKNNKTNQKIIETAKKHSDDFFYYNNGITIICDSCIVTGGSPSKLDLRNYQVVNGGQTIHSIFEAAKSDYNCLGKIDVLCRVFAGTDKAKQREICRFTNTQTLVTERDLSSLDYIQMLLNEEFELNNLKYERKKDQYKQHSRKLKYDSHKTGQLLLAYKLGKPHVARSNKKAVFSDAYVEKIFDENVTAEMIVNLYRLEVWLKGVAAEYRVYCRNAWLYVLYFYKLIYENYKTEDSSVSDVLNIDFTSPDEYAEKCYKCTFKVLQYIVEKKKQGDEYYDDSNYFKTEIPIRDFRAILEKYGDSIEELESIDFSTSIQSTGEQSEE